MINDKIIIFIGIVGFILLAIFAGVYEFYKYLSKPVSTKVYGKVSLENSINKLDNRLTSLESTTENILKDIAIIKKKINIK